MYRQILLGGFLYLFSFYVLATNVVSSATVTQSLKITKDINNQSLTMANLNDIDNEADDLNKLRRQKEIEEAKAELKKIKNPPIINNNMKSTSEDSQTIVTGVAINQQGKKVAWLQFADGGTLTVNIGSKVGKYVVSNITMTGVALSFTKATKYSKSQVVFLKRVYYATNKRKQDGQHINNFFTPSPVITNANTLNTNETVPAIITMRQP